MLCLRVESSGAAVIVQTMVDARIAGVAFSTAPDNPVVGTIEYVEGLGEGLVSGDKTPGSAWFSRAQPMRMRLTIVSNSTMVSAGSLAVSGPRSWVPNSTRWLTRWGWRAA